MPPLQLPLVREEWIPIELCPELFVRNILNSHIVMLMHLLVGAIGTPNAHSDEVHACTSFSDRRCL